MTQATKAREARHIRVKGVVQGVGFRPFVYQLAAKHNLAGWVCNTSGDVQIEVEGESHQLARFLDELRSQAPPQSHITDVAVNQKPATGYKTFEIRPSLAQDEQYQLISPDLATCEACREEIFAPKDRRYHYPFTNCTNCGPRFTIIEDIPYDRPRTTMKQFKMCPDCQREYDNPLDRRFHAQPNACPVCGPSLQLTDSRGSILPCTDIIKKASELLIEGKILAIRGLGGFLLACDATNEQAVSTLRERKRRPYKPLAIMVPGLEKAKQYCQVSAEEEKVLMSAVSPIVLLRRKPEDGMAANVAPGLKHLGVMLPYTPLHHLLLLGVDRPLVMTSGNLSEEPIAKDNDEALRRLSGIADYFLLHNREIYSRYDDSVVIVEKDKPRVVRRARGYAPHPIRLPFQSKQVLACGAELKNTFCLTKEDNAFVSQHVGDLENYETLEHFQNTLTLYQRLFRIRPQIIACDMHPDYLATRWAKAAAEKKKLPLVPAQHHHAHIVSCMAENGVRGPVIGVAFDGTGYGVDGNIWGGEFIIADYKGFKRAAHLEYLPLSGGDAAVKKPYRIAIGYLYSLLGAEALKPELPCLKNVTEAELSLLKQQIDKKLNTPLTSSSGRLFDAVAALIGVRQQIDYEAQAAVELEMVAYEASTKAAYPYAIETVDGVKIIRVAELFSSIIEDLAQKVGVAEIAHKFHNTMAEMIGKVCSQLAQETGIHTVALSGGVFQNRLLFNKTTEKLEGAGFTVLTHSQVPCNDGGISLGQALIANAQRS